MIVLRIFYWLALYTAKARAFAMCRFTAAGLAILSGVLISMIMGVDTDHNVEYQAFTLLFALIAQAILFTLNFRARFSAVRLLPRFATAGASLHYKIHLRNLSRKAQVGLSVLENLAAPYPSFNEWKSAQLQEEQHLRSFRFSRHKRRTPIFNSVKLKPIPVDAVLAANGDAEIHAELMPLRRGLLHLKGVTLTRTDPLGLFRAFSKVAASQKVLVLPKRYRLPAIPLPGAVKYQQGGVAMASNVGQSEDFVALRDYRRGDPLRHIHWRSWAKVGKPVVKEFEDEFFVRHALVLDTFADYEYSDAFEEAVSVAASFACTIVTQESLLDLLFVGPESYTFTAGRGLAHADQILEVLASVSICRKQPFKSLEALVLNHSQQVSGCICVFLAWDRARQEFVQKLKGLGVPLLVLVVVAPGAAKNPDPGPMADELENFRVLDSGRIEEDLATLAP